MASLNESWIGAVGAVVVVVGGTPLNVVAGRKGYRRGPRRHDGRGRHHDGHQEQTNARHRVARPFHNVALASAAIASIGPVAPPRSRCFGSPPHSPPPIRAGG